MVDNGEQTVADRSFTGNGVAVTLTASRALGIVEVKRDQAVEQAFAVEGRRQTITGAGTREVKPCGVQVTGVDEHREALARCVAAGLKRNSHSGKGVVPRS